MSVAETSTHYEVIDHNVVPDLYVTYIVDIWEGDRNDPATEVVRYIGTWRAEDLEAEDVGAFDPDWLKFDPVSYRGWRRYEPAPLMWETLESVKKADGDAQRMRSEYENLTDPEGYAYGSQRVHKELYTKFLDAVDVLAEHPDDEQAWEAVNAYRQYQALKHER